MRNAIEWNNREFKQIATAGANTAAGSKLPESGGFAVVATTSGLFRFSDLFLRTSQHLKSSNRKYILWSQFQSKMFSSLPLIRM